MKKRIVYPVIISVIICLCSLNNIKVIALEESDLYATYCSVIDSETGRVLFEKKGDMQVPMASTTKILTCILVLEQGNLDDFVETSKYAASMPKVHMGARAGEYYKVEDLLYALMLESYNDAAVILAEYISGSVEDFVAVMNRKAESIGCEKFHFVTSNGLDGKDSEGEHSISATDLAKIMAYCTNQSPYKDEFIKITTTKAYSFPAYKSGENGFVKSGKTIQCTNRNSLLSNSNVVSGKTGFTNKAGYCYVCQTQINGRQVSFALLACGWPNNKNYKWSDSKEIIAYIQNDFSEEEIYYPELEEELYPQIINGKKVIGDKQINCPKINLSYYSETYFLSKEDVVGFVFDVDEEIMAPMNLGTIVGELQVYINEKQVDVIPLYLTENIEENTFSSCAVYVLKIFMENIKKINFFG